MAPTHYAEAQAEEVEESTCADVKAEGDMTYGSNILMGGMGRRSSGQLWLHGLWLARDRGCAHTIRSRP